ncbi:hypothetical protein [Sandaracinus amylolyticus]|uniref:hypothetical protein n=1 Tax=Sandaracinus amylolyticus TaxID=927083 RepID=UPI001F4752F7|nr:hypothetical protein [Sandaracinus amylolyticus]UJR84794.1 Hypothetical protein I5071_68730 [Sandaracinus amylolyticus]
MAVDPRDHPLGVQAIELVEGEILVARANWDRLEVRDEHGALRFAHEIARPGWLLREMRFVGRSLACAIGTDISCVGMQLWDVSTGRCTVEHTHPDVDGPALYWSAQGTSLLLAHVGDGAVLLDVDRQIELVAPMVVDALCGAPSPELDRFAFGGWERVSIRDRDGVEVLAIPNEIGDIDDIAWTKDGLLVVAPVRSRVEVRDARDGSLRFVTAGRGLRTTSPCGRWAVLDRALLDLHTRAEHPLEHSHHATFDLARGDLVLADTQRTWRVPLPR